MIIFGFPPLVLASIMLEAQRAFAACGHVRDRSASHAAETGDRDVEP